LPENLQRLTSAFVVSRLCPLNDEHTHQPCQRRGRGQPVPRGVDLLLVHVVFITVGMLRRGTRSSTTFPSQRTITWDPEAMETQDRPCILYMHQPCQRRGRGRAVHRGVDHLLVHVVFINVGVFRRGTRSSTTFPSQRTTTWAPEAMETQDRPCILFGAEWCTWLKGYGSHFELSGGMTRWPCILFGAE